MIKNYLILCVFSFSIGFAQTDITKNKLDNVFTINIINPGVDYEWGLTQNIAISTGLGIGYSGSYKELTIGTENGFIYVIAPFIDVQGKYIYNRNRRAAKGKNVLNNTGNFISFRVLTRGWSIADNVLRTDNFDFSVGPTWGLQRTYGKFRILFDIGPQFYFDTNGNSGFFPAMPQLNIGFKI